LHEISDLAWGGEAEAAVIDLLLRAGARIDAQDWMGRTPLFAACYKMGTEEFAPPIAEHLINRGAAVNLANADGFVPLLLAVARGDVALAQLLVSRGASPYVRTTGTRQLYNGKTLLIDNHDGVEIPVGTRPIDLATSGAMCGALTFPY
jgi:ankyrin repeat protein